MMNASDILRELLDVDSKEEIMIAYWYDTVETGMMTLETAPHAASKPTKADNIHYDYKLRIYSTA